jgi:hypothetical protein
MSDPNDLVQVAAYGYLHEAELAAGALEAAGIESMVRDEFVAGVRPHLTFTDGGVRLFVRASDRDRATEVLESVARDFQEEAE